MRTSASDCRTRPSELALQKGRKSESASSPLDEDADPATISQIKQEWTAIDRAMDKEWEENFGLEPSLMPGLGRTPPQSN